MKKIFLILLVLLGLKTQTQAQWSACDSISYTTSSTINFPFGVSGAISPNIGGTITWEWWVCTSNVCYASYGINAGFGQVSLTDTIKVCYEVWIDLNGFTYICSRCDTLVYNPNSYQWEPATAPPTAVNEIKLITINNDKIYDLLGRELKYPPTGKMYIRNNRLCIGK